MSRASETRERILEAARRLVIERGFQRLSLGDIGAAAGRTRQSVYLQFGSRAGLLRALVDHVREREGHGERAAAVRRPRSAAETLDLAVQGHSEYTPRIYPFASAVYDARNVEPAARAMWRYRMDQRRARHRKLVRRLRREHVLDPEWSIDEATDLMLWLLGLHTWDYLVVQFGWSRDRYVKALRLLTHRILLAEDRPRRGQRTRVPARRRRRRTS